MIASLMPSFVLFPALRESDHALGESCNSAGADSLASLLVRSEPVDLREAIAQTTGDVAIG